MTLLTILGYLLGAVVTIAFLGFIDIAYVALLGIDVWEPFEDISCAVKYSDEKMVKRVLSVIGNVLFITVALPMYLLIAGMRLVMHITER